MRSLFYIITKVIKGEVSINKVIYYLFHLKLKIPIGTISIKIFRYLEKTNFSKSFPDHIEILNINTYDELNQVVHPDVIINQIKEYPAMYVMVITPYPFGDERYENPCIYISRNGIDWRVPEGTTNPLAVPEGEQNNHLSDPEIIFANDKYWLYFRESVTQNTKKIDRIYRLESNDLINWTTKKLLYETTTSKILSPSIIFYQGEYQLYYVNNIDNKFLLERCVSSNGEFVNKEIINIKDSPLDKILWHIDIVSEEKILKGLFVYASGNGGYCSELYYGESLDDGLNWRIINKINVCKDSNKIFKSVYRSSLVKKPDGQWNLYFSANTISGSWYTYLIRDFKPYLYY